MTLLQTQFLPAFLPEISQYIPDLVLLVIVSWALLLDWRWSLTLAFGAGLLLDFMSPRVGLIGLTALLFSLVALGVSFVAQNPLRSGVIRAVPVALVAALSYRFFRLIAERILSYNTFQSTIIFQVVLPVVIIDAALMVVIFGIVRLVTRVRVPRE